MRFLRSISLWLSAAILVATPLLLAIDFGGVYHWSQYIAAVAILAAAAFALPGLTDSNASSSVKQQTLLIPLGILAGWAWLQATPLPAGWVQWISPGAYAAYAEWLNGLIPGDAASRDYSISVSPLDTSHTASLLAMLLPLSLASSIAFHARGRLQMLLSAIAIAGASVAILGFYRKLDPTADLWIFRPKSNSFAGFVNRNNAALMLNFGLAASLGLMSWRMMALHHIELDDPDFEFNDLFALISDRESFTGLIAGATCIAGLLINGSRGGLVAAMFGLVLAFGYVRPKRGLLSLPILVLVLAVSVAILITPMQLNLESLSRLELLSTEADTLQSDGRLSHWQDGWDAALAYFPGGSGVASYGYAYLPYINMSQSPWFEHADNLWLEMLVETGLVGILVMVLIITLAIIALNRLALSVDPLDQGIRVACWYSLGAVFTSQFFDFGLALPANLFVGVMLLSALISRDIANGGVAAKLALQAHHDVSYGHHETESEYWDDDEFPDDNATNPAPEDTPAPQNTTRPLDAKNETTGRKIALRSDSNRWISHTLISCTTVAVITIVIGATAIPTLREDAFSDSMLYRLKDEYGKWRLNPDSLTQMEDALTERINTRPMPPLYSRLETVQQDRGRLIETTEWKPNTPEEFVSIYKRTHPETRKLPYPPNNNRNQRVQLDSYPHYADAWKTSIAALAKCPLAQQPRTDLLQLAPLMSQAAASQATQTNNAPTETAIQETATTAIQQLLLFYSGAPRRLLTLANEALNRRDWTTAEEGFRMAVSRQPNLARNVMQQYKTHPEIDLNNAIPDSPSALKIAAEIYIKSPNPDPKFLRRALDQIRCETNESLKQRASCEALSGRILFHFESPDEATEHFVQAIQYAPDVPNYRIELIESLLKFDRPADAKSQARLGRNSFPENTRFQKFIDDIAAKERQQLVQPDNGPTIDQDALEDLLN